MPYRLGARSRRMLAGVHPDLVAVVRRAIGYTAQDFAVFEGVRSVETQAAYVARGVSKTMASRHLVQPDGFGHAVDLVPWVNGRLDWCDDRRAAYDPIAAAMWRAAGELGLHHALQWGGQWRWFDGAHWQLR